MKRIIGIIGIVAGLGVGGALMSACYTGQCVVYSSGSAGQGRTIIYGGSCQEAYWISAQIPGSTVAQAP